MMPVAAPTDLSRTWTATLHHYAETSPSATNGPQPIPNPLSLSGNSCPYKTVFMEEMALHLKTHSSTVNGMIGAATSSSLSSPITSPVQSFNCLLCGFQLADAMHLKMHHLQDHSMVDSVRVQIYLTDTSNLIVTLPGHPNPLGPGVGTREGSTQTSLCGLPMEPRRNHATRAIQHRK